MGKVQRITDFGAFVEIMPGIDGLLHVSEIADHRVKDVRDELKEGEQMMVKVINVDPSGKIRLSRKALLQRRRARRAAGRRYRQATPVGDEPRRPRPPRVRTSPASGAARSACPRPAGGPLRSPQGWSRWPRRPCPAGLVSAPLSGPRPRRTTAAARWPSRPSDGGFEPARIEVPQNDLVESRSPPATLRTA